MSTILQRRRGSRIADSTSVESPPEPPRPPSPPRPQRRRSFSDHISSFPHDLWTILSSSYFNILLIFVPFALPSDLLGWSSSAVFATNFLALIPLALLLSYSTRQGSKRLGSTLGGLVNITFGNATELIVGIAALLNDEIKLIQTTLMGSILSTLLFVTGVTFVVGGIKNAEYNDWVAQTMSSMMFVATVSLILPTAFEFALPTGLSTEEGVLGLSRGTAVILLILYVSYIFFQMKTHHEHFSAKHRGDSISVPRPMNPSSESPNSTDATSEETPVRPVSIGEPNRSTPEPTPTPTSTTTQEDPVGLPASLTMTILAAVATSICSDNLVGSINGVVLSSGMSKTFFGLILIPIVGNAAECVTAVQLVWNNNMNDALAITMGSSVQISLFVTPFLVLLGWFLDKPMSLNFQTFQAAVIFLSVTSTEFLIMDGRPGWMKGALLLGTYSIVAISYAVYPDIPYKEVTRSYVRKLW